MKKPEDSAHFKLMNMNKLKQYLIAISLLMMASACTGIYEDGTEMAADVKSSAEEISVDELKAKLEKGEEFLLIDVRQASEYDNSAIPGAINMPRGVLEFKIRDDQYWEQEFLYTPSDSVEIIVYCKSGYRGALSTLALKQLGFLNVKNLKGGMLSYDPNLDKGAPKKSSGGGCGG
jgi:rhodanese-related sulfurtransferase